LSEPAVFSRRFGAFAEAASAPGGSPARRERFRAPIFRSLIPQGMNMRNAKRPSGPGKPEKEVRDAVRVREELDELAASRNGDDAPAGRDPTRSARQAERDAHGGRTRDASTGGGNRDQER
jgi:hypothetical protein